MEDLPRIGGVRYKALPQLPGAWQGRGWDLHGITWKHMGQRDLFNLLLNLLCPLRRKSLFYASVSLRPFWYVLVSLK